MVDPSCTKNPTHLQALVKSVYDYASKLLDASNWERYWLVSYRHGVEVSRKLIYEVTLQKNMVATCACSLISKVTNLSMKAIDALYGTAQVKFI